MSLSHEQKNYIKKYVKQFSLAEIAKNIDADEETVINYLEKKWGKEKLKKYLKPTGKIQSIYTSSGFKIFLKDHWQSFLILTILVFFTYIFFLNNAFISDDIAEIAQKPEISNFSRILEYPFGWIRHFIYWVAVHLGGFNPPLFRLTNLVFHLLSACLIYIALFSMYKSKRIALITSSLFAIHPAIAEAVLWISGGMYAQYTFFFLLSFVLYIKSQKLDIFYFGSVIFYLCSLMSHPVMPVALWLIFPLYDFCFNNFKKNWFKALPFLFLAIIYVFVNLSALPERETTLQTLHYQEKGTDNLFLTLPLAISSYAELLFFPKTLTLYHSELNFGVFSFIARSIFTLIFFISIPLALIKKKKSLFFWLSFFVISLSPTLTPFRLNWIVAERYIYLSSIGIFALIALGLERLIHLKQRFTPIILCLFTVIILVLSVRTFMRGIDWKSEDNLWIATGKTSPSSPNTHNNLGDVYGRQGDKQRSLSEFLYAIELKPNYADAYHNAGNVYRELNQMDKAIEFYQKAAEINPYLWQSYQNIAAMYFQNGNYDLAEVNIQKAIAINPKNFNLVNNLGIIYLTRGEKEKAKQVFQSILAQDPNNQVAQAGYSEASK